MHHVVLKFGGLPLAVLKKKKNLSGCGRILLTFCEWQNFAGFHISDALTQMFRLLAGHFYKKKHCHMI